MEFIKIFGTWLFSVTLPFARDTHLNLKLKKFRFRFEKFEGLFLAVPFIRGRSDWHKSVVGSLQVLKV